MYQYFVPVCSEEHYLNKTEIASLYGLYSVSGKPHNRVISALFNMYLIDQQFYYLTAMGNMMEVFPKSYYEPIMTQFLQKLNFNNNLAEIIINDKKFIIKRRDN